MIYPRGQNNQIALLKPDPHPLIPLTPNVKVPRSVANVSYLLVLVKMLVEEHFHLGFVDIAHGGGGDGDFIAVLVVAVAGEGVDGGEIGVVGVEDAEGGELGWRDGAGWVVGETLVALWIKSGWDAAIIGLVEGKER
jgi:hypothetical protein